MFQPNYRITHKILKDIAHIEAAKEIIENSPLIPSYERKFKDEALIRAVHYSTHIEGNPLNFSDAKKVLEGKAEDLVARERDINDIINYRNVLKYIENIQKAPIDEKTILTIHKVVMDKILTSEKSGKFRLEKVAVRNSKTKEISFTPPKAEEVGKLVQDFILWLSSQEAKETFPVLKAGISHYELARIHPFVDGNGRTARALTTLILYREGYDIKNFFCLDEYYDRNLQNYYQALQSVKPPDNDLTGWLEYFSFGLLDEFSKIKEKVLKISRDVKIKKNIGQVVLNERQERIVEFISDYGKIQNQDWHNLFPEISDDTILRELKDLVKKKVIKKRGKTKAAYYELR